ncbi:hypothetical protein BLGI_841 [Brevibacillus laterosporus GI-9]|nr:hypothetical protein BLGI_841 [Brevibacillus laterosporus GI-9]
MLTRGAGFIITILLRKKIEPVFLQENGFINNFMLVSRE